jgi:hypothetical protein
MVAFCAPARVTKGRGAAHAHRPKTREEVEEMRDVARELGQTIRAAMRSWPETLRLCALLAVTVAAVACYTLWAR